MSEEGQKSFPGRRNFYLQRPVEGGTMASVKDWKGQAPQCRAGARINIRSHSKELCVCSNSSGS